jgi:hypothetical protein
MASMNVRPIPEIFTDLVAQVTALVRKEAQLARAEISEKASRAFAGMALMLVGAVLLIPGLTIFLQAAMAGLVENGMEASMASAIVGGAALILGIVLALIGWSRVNPASLVPDKTIDQLQRDASMARNAASATPSHDTSRRTERETGHGYHADRAA